MLSGVRNTIALNKTAGDRLTVPVDLLYPFESLMSRGCITQNRSAFFCIICNWLRKHQGMELMLVLTLVSIALGAIGITIQLVDTKKK